MDLSDYTLLSLMRERQPQAPNVDTRAMRAMDPIPAVHGDDEKKQFYAELKRKRRTAQLKQLLANAGYGDLVKSIRIKEGVRE